MAVAVSVLGTSLTTNLEIVVGTLTLSAKYGGATSHGDTVDFSTFDVIKSHTPPMVHVFESPAAGAAALGYGYVFCPGTTLANGVLQIIGATATGQHGGTEITENADYSAQTPSLDAAVLYFIAYFAKFS